MSADGLCTAPASVPSTNPVAVKATSDADETKSDTAAVTINPMFAISTAAGNSLTGSYTLASNGRGEIALTVGTSTRHYAAYAISTRLVVATPIDSGSEPSPQIAYQLF
jgi:hypothetical protein